MHRDASRYKSFSRRAALLFGGKLLLLSGLIGRMYYLQILEGRKYQTLADENRISLKLIPPKRGRILDRFGRPMAINQQNYRVMLVPENTEDIELTLMQLGKIIPISNQDIVRAKRRLKRKRSFQKRKRTFQNGKRTFAKMNFHKTKTNSSPLPA